MLQIDPALSQNNSQNQAASQHHPVMLQEMLAAVRPSFDSPHPICIDATFGGGGYSEALLHHWPQLRLFGLDRDPEAIERGRLLQDVFGPRLTVIKGCFGALAEHLAEHIETTEGLARPLTGGVDGIVLDLGVSSFQIDQPERGFSFQKQGPLDMRMSSAGLSAAEILNTAPEEILAQLLYIYGEEPFARRIARNLVRQRYHKKLTTTQDFVDNILQSIPLSVQRRSRIHPATRSFQALRIAVNDELAEIIGALWSAEQLLKPGGRLVVVSFHSLEDRIVKRFLKPTQDAQPLLSADQPLQEEKSFDTQRALVGKQPLIPHEEEIRANPRARSAKMRVGERTNLLARSLSVKKKWIDSVRIPGLIDQ